MKKLLVSTVSALALFSSISFAEHQGDAAHPVNAANAAGNYGGGFTGPTQGISTVNEVLNAGMFSDDKPVTLTGHITASLGGEMYKFADSTGVMTVEIDADKWFGLQVTPQTKITILGEIDKEFNGTKIDVDQIRLAP